MATKLFDVENTSQSITPWFPKEQKNQVILCNVKSMEDPEYDTYFRLSTQITAHFFKRYAHIFLCTKRSEETLLVKNVPIQRIVHTFILQCGVYKNVFIMTIEPCDNWKTRITIENVFSENVTKDDIYKQMYTEVITDFMYSITETVLELVGYYAIAEMTRKHHLIEEDKNNEETTPKTFI
jgi:hypothetical protein